MGGYDGLIGKRHEALVEELTATALTALAEHGVGGTSIDLEIRLWHRLQDAVCTLPTNASGVEEDWEHQLAFLTRTAYEAVQEQGFAGSFLDLEMALWQALRRVVRKNSFLTGRPAHTLHHSAREGRASGRLAVR